MRTRTEVLGELADLDAVLSVFDAPAELFGVKLMRDSLDRRREVLVEELRRAEATGVT